MSPNVGTLEEKRPAPAVGSYADPRDRMAATHAFGEFGGVNMSIEPSTTFTVMDSKTMPEIFGGRQPVDVAGEHGVQQAGCFLYSRHFNPTVLQLGHELAALEGTEAAYPCASGMAAITATLLQLCRTGDHVVCSNTVYGGTYAFLHDFAPNRLNITTTFVDINDLDAVEQAVQPGKTKVIYTEAVANPTLRVADIPSLATISRRHDLQLVVDNTFSPLLIQPATLGADVVVHSLTKFVNGASDIVGGVVCGRTSFIVSLMDLHEGCFMLLGPTMDPTVAFHISARLPHLPLRMREHSRRAEMFAQRLQALGLKVQYPGLPTHPQHDLLRVVMTGAEEYGFGGMLTLDVGTRERAFQLMNELQNNQGFGHMAVSLGFHDTLMSCSASTTSSEMSDADLQAAGIQPGLIRMSIGISGKAETRWQQLHNGLASVGLIKTQENEGVHGA
eukprot:comp8632_c0_seq1/m.3922 comp8632_c0_seq1/g.3922  ORF comp8632_c0_seq1/g.3922 comp8632_c0_seq1/m.3922 type:complete len:446 (-) comp8632_c0_seq1:383-1720(-)